MFLFTAALQLNMFSNFIFILLLIVVMCPGLHFTLERLFINKIWFDFYLFHHVSVQ